MRNVFFLFIIPAFLSCSPYLKEAKIHREEFRQEFLHDERSPLKLEDLDDLDFFNPDPKAVVHAKFVLTPDSQPFELPTYSGITRTYRQYGINYFVFGIDSARLSVYENMKLLDQEEYKDYLFLPFKDETNGISTYGGGRYLNLSKKDGEDGVMTIDFNRSYNPWCAYSDGFNCPIPPNENHLSFEVKAGEKKWSGEYKSSKPGH